MLCCSEIWGAVEIYPRKRLNWMYNSLHHASRCSSKGLWDSKCVNYQESDTFNQGCFHHEVVLQAGSVVSRVENNWCILYNLETFIPLLAFYSSLHCTHEKYANKQTVLIRIFWNQLNYHPMYKNNKILKDQIPTFPDTQEVYPDTRTSKYISSSLNFLISFSSW